MTLASSTKTRLLKQKMPCIQLDGKVAHYWRSDLNKLLVQSDVLLVLLHVLDS